MAEAQDMQSELAVTKNDIAHMQRDLEEIKTGQKEGFEKVHASIVTIIESTDAKYVRKGEHEDLKREVAGLRQQITKYSAAIWTGTIMLMVYLILNIVSGKIHL